MADDLAKKEGRPVGRPSQCSTSRYYRKDVENTTFSVISGPIIVPLLVDHSTKLWVTVEQAANLTRASERTIRKNVARFGRVKFGRWWIYVPALLASDDAEVVRQASGSTRGQDLPNSST